MTSTDLVLLDPDAPPPRKRFSLRKALQLVVVLPVASTAAWYGHEWLMSGRFILRAQDARIDGEVTVVAAEIPGTIARLLVTTNQRVRAGDLLVSLDDRAYRAALNKVEVAIAEQQATLAYLDGIERLQQEPDEARQALLEKQKQQTRVKLEAAIAEQQAVRSQFERTQVRAPTDGIVDSTGVQVGAPTEAGQPLISILPGRGVWVAATFSERQLAGIHPGQAATIQTAVLPGVALRGRVAALVPDPTATTDPRHQTVRIQLDPGMPPRALLRPGLPVTADVDTRDPE